MKYKDLVKHYGSGARAAEAIGVARTTVANWRRRGIPEVRQYMIQELTRGRLRRRARA